ncbi:MAG: glycosyltransferase family 39 protein [Verrucomicrobiota bacterium]
MHWIQSLDTALFLFINDTLTNPVFDAVMPFVSQNRYFIPALVIAALAVFWKGGARGRVCVLMAALIVATNDGLLINTLKHTVQRPRPFLALEEVHFRQGSAQFPRGIKITPEMSAGLQSMMDQDEAAGEKPNHNSMPSAHAANWFAATMILLVYYRRSWWFMLPMASLVAFSRVYNGMHFPSDVLAGAVLGAGYAAAASWTLNGLWIWAGQKWFPLWWKNLPSLLSPECGVRSADPAMSENSELGTQNSTLDDHWLRLGYLMIAITTAVNLIYLASGVIELSGDEAYQWVWSKHLDLSYYSKPPMIAYLQHLGTSLWGDTEFGVRFLSPIIGAILGVLVLRFFAREVSARLGFLLLLILQATPLLAVGSILMTIDPPSVLFWTAAMLAGWKAVQPDGKTSQWCWTGLWMALGFLSKYTQLFQLLSWVVLFILWKPSRVHLRRPGPYLALLINLAGTIPVLLWNARHDWITVTHVAERGGAGQAWHPLRNFGEFMASEAFLLNPFFFFPMLWAAVAFWRRSRHDARMVYLFSMGAPLFLCYLLFTVRARVLPNWIAPAVIPLFCLNVIYFDPFVRRSRLLQVLQGIGIAFGLGVSVFLHDTSLFEKVTGRLLPAKIDPLTRVRGNADMAKFADEARRELEAKEGVPTFIIGGHYQTVGQISFYLPEARTNIQTRPLVYYLTSDRPVNQFYFWPGYANHRRGQNAIFVREMPLPPLAPNWVKKWMNGKTNLSLYPPFGFFPPPSLTNEFETVIDLGLRHSWYRGQIYGTVQLFECRNLK